MRGRSIVILLAVALQACSYITQREFEEKRDSIDEDQDGEPQVSDCDDLDPDRSFLFEEIPYDGIDNDCDKVDIVDMDGDGFPGIIDADYALLDPKVPFPDLLVGKLLDCIDDPALRAEAASIHPPPNDTELPYDGIDSDCDRGNDFDVDGDGWLARYTDTAEIDVAAAYQQYVESWGYAGEESNWAPAGQAAPQLDDCNDFEFDVHPDPLTPDLWYDGIDQDCDDGNDFDQDGDGFMPPTLPDGTPTIAAYYPFITAYHDDLPPWTLPLSVTTPDGILLDAFSDCLDDPALAPVAAGGITPVDPADVHPLDSTLTDIWYDGIDTNCWSDNDFDQDLDAFLPITARVDGENINVTTAYADYVTYWSYSDREDEWGAPNGLSAPGTDDCDDEDAATYPAALELLGDQADQDCDSQPDTAAFSFAGWIWDRPSPPRVTRLGNTYVIVTSTPSLDLGAGDPLVQVAVALTVRLEDARTGVIPGIVQYKNGLTPDPIGDVVDIALIPNDQDLSGDTIADPGAWVGATYDPLTGLNTYLLARQIYENSVSGTISIGKSIVNFPSFIYDANSLEITVNAVGEPYIMACTDDLLHAMQGLDPQPTEPQLLDETSDRGDLCFIKTDPYPSGANEIVEYTRCSDTLCNDYSLALSSDLQTAQNGNTGELWTSAHTHGSMQVLLDGTDMVARNLALGEDYLLFTGETVLSGDAIAVHDQLFAAAIIDDGGEPVIRLTYGAYPTLETLDLPFVGATVPDAAPTDVALHVDDDRILVAVAARDRTGTPNQDVIGWMFLGTP